MREGKCVGVEDIYFLLRKDKVCVTANAMYECELLCVGACVHDFSGHSVCACVMCYMSSLITVCVHV